MADMLLVMQGNGCSTHRQQRRRVERGERSLHLLQGPRTIVFYCSKIDLRGRLPGTRRRVLWQDYGRAKPPAAFAGRTVRRHRHDILPGHAGSFSACEQRAERGDRGRHTSWLGRGGRPLS